MPLGLLHPPFGFRASKSWTSRKLIFRESENPQNVLILAGHTPFNKVVEVSAPEVDAMRAAVSGVSGIDETEMVSFHTLPLTSSLFRM